MTHLVLYDSQFGNTENIAQAIGRGIGGDVVVKSAGDTGNITWSDIRLLVVGSPTQGGRPTATLQKVFATIPPNGLAQAKVAAFDTRFKEEDHKLGLKLLMRTIGYASTKILKILEGKGGTSAAQPEGFFVSDKEGPLKAGELERAEAWGKHLAH